MHTLPQLAVRVARAAATKQVNADDAMDLYLEYFQSAHPTRRVKHTDPTVKANASKLRIVIRAADPALLEKVTRVRDKLARSEAVKALYVCMIDACRAVLRKRNSHNARALLSDGEIIVICRRKPK